MKVLAATLLAMVFVTSGSAMAGGKKPAKATAKQVCSAAQKKAGKCGAVEATKANISTTVAAPTSVRSGSMESPNSRAPASVMDNNTH